VFLLHTCTLCVNIYTYFVSCQINLLIILSVRYCNPDPKVSMLSPQIRNKKGSKGWGGYTYHFHICVKLAVSLALGDGEYGRLGCDSRIETWCSDTIQFLSVAQRVPLSQND
jgi:hypothetical protein